MCMEASKGGGLLLGQLKGQATALLPCQATACSPCGSCSPCSKASPSLWRCHRPTPLASAPLSPPLAGPSLASAPRFTGSLIKDGCSTVETQGNSSCCQHVEGLGVGAAHSTGSAASMYSISWVASDQALVCTFWCPGLGPRVVSAPVHGRMCAWAVRCLHFVSTRVCTCLIYIDCKRRATGQFQVEVVTFVASCRN